MKKKGLVIVIIICLVVMLGSLTAASILAVRTIGWADLKDHDQLRQKISNLIDHVQLPEFLKGERQTFNIDETRVSGLVGINEIKITGISEQVLVKTGGSQVEARLFGSYLSWGAKLTWILERRGDQLVIYADYPRFGTLWNDLAIEILIPAEYAGSVKVGTVSGDCLLAGEADRSWSSFQFNGVSGSLTADRANFPEVRFTSVSGNVTIGRCTGKADGDTVSGEVEIGWEKFMGAGIKTISGDVNLVLPATSDAAINFSTVSGKFETSNLQINISSQQKRKLVATLNKGDYPLSVNTVSGGLSIVSP